MGNRYQQVALVTTRGMLAALPIAAQSGSSAGVRDLRSRLEQAKLDSVAARVPDRTYADMVTVLISKLLAAPTAPPVPSSSGPSRRSTP
jgi:hypothetical protein